MNILYFTAAALIYVVCFITKIFMDKKIQHGFTKDLESLKHTLIANNIELSNNLKQKNDQFDLLREITTSRINHKNDLLYKKKIEASEQLWDATLELSKNTLLCQTLFLFNIEEVEKDLEIAKDVFKDLGKAGIASNLKEMPKDIAKTRLYVSPKCWALYNAYSTIISVSVAQFELLKTGNSTKSFNIESIQKVLLEALPHQKKFIEEYDFNSYYLLLEELKNLILSEIKDVLNNQTNDYEDIKQAQKIMEVIYNIDNEKITQKAA